MRKNEEPHRLSVQFDPSAMEPSISTFQCSCAAGQGLCQHVIGLLYTLAHYQMMGIKSVPPVVSKTSKPQTWYIPSCVVGIEPKAVLDVTVQKVISPQAKSDRKRKKVSGVTSTVFKPFQQPLSTLNMANVLRPFFENLTPRPGFLRI